MPGPQLKRGLLRIPDAFRSLVYSTARVTCTEYFQNLLFVLCQSVGFYLSVTAAVLL